MKDKRDIVAHADSPEQTKLLAKSLSRFLRPGDIVLLSGDLGAGKTQFVQGIALGLGVSEILISPTFNIVISYTTGCLPLHHFDLYRLDSAEQLEDIGLREYVESNGVCVVEWAEKFPQAFDDFIAIDLEKTAVRSRNVRVSANGSRAHELLEAWKEAIGSSSSCGTLALDAYDASDGRERVLDEDAPCDDASGERAHATDAMINSPDSARFGDCGAQGRSDYGPEEGRVKGDSADRFVLAFDTANEMVAMALGLLVEKHRRVEVIATREIAAHRASNTTLVPAVDELLASCGVVRSSLACVCVGRGPGSFTGVRIAMATAKGIAQALSIALVGVSTLDAIAWNVQAHGARGQVLVVADAMRKEVYPVRYVLADEGVSRLTADRVVKVEAFQSELSAAVDEVANGVTSNASNNAPSDGAPFESARDISILNGELVITGDALAKYRELFEPYGQVLSDKLWEVAGWGLLLAFQSEWREGRIDPLDATRHDPAFVLPVYTRLSDAEENERTRRAESDKRDLASGVQGASSRAALTRATMHSQANLVAREDDRGIAFRPLDALDASAVSALESRVMGSDAWAEWLVADELGRKDRSWWVAEHDRCLVGYAGGLVVDGDLQVLKVAVVPEWRRKGIARELLAHVAEDARNLGASTCSLEVRVSNADARAFYVSLGFKDVGIRPRYYSDREDAAIMSGPLPSDAHDVAGMELQHLDVAMTRARTEVADGGDLSRTEILSKERASLIFAIESSCDETAAAVVNGEGALLSDVVASQIDFHARFGGVVPEIASRKHIEAICGVCAEALDSSGCGWRDLSAIAVTYAPGLLGALVVGVAFAKGVAWALDIPFIGVNHLEGHLYANKLGNPDFAPPAVVSLVSGGNTMLVHMRDWGDYATLGATIDDAVGEAFDKVSKALGLGYPGGPAISRLAAKGNPDAVPFPRAMLHSHDLRFSLSGLKTAVVNYINEQRESGRELDIPDIAASFQQAVIDVQVAKAATALKETGARTFCLGGGVAANPALRAAYEELCARLGVKLIMPPLSSCGDNAGMIALVALDRFTQGKFLSLDADAHAHANLDEPY